MSVVSEIYDVIKDLRDLAKNYKDSQMSEKVIEIQEKFFDLRDEMETLREENNDLKESLKDLQDTLSIEEDLELTEQGCYIRKSEKEQGKNIIYCAACWQKYKKLMPYINSIGNAWQCSNCHNVITSKGGNSYGTS